MTIYQGVTLCHGGSVVGEGVLFSVGSVLLPGRDVGNSAKIGANVVVVENVPDYATVITGKPIMIL